jgi:type VI secretion system protein ImpK
LRLIDCFLGVMAATVFATRSDDQAPVDAEAFRRDVETLLAQGEKAAQDAGFSKDDIDQARFAVCAYVDEVIQLSGWSARELWAAAPLQRAYYNTTNAGVEFFKRLDSLTEDNVPVREVYATCLAAGFKGQYFQERHSQTLTEIRKSNLRSVWGDDYSDASLSAGLLFPQAYAPEGQKGKGRHIWRRGNLSTLILFIIPPLVTLMAYLFYRMQLNKAIFDFFKTAL